MEAGEEVVQYPSCKRGRLLEGYISQTSEWSKGTKDASVDDTFWFTGVCSSNTLNLSIVVPVMISSQPFDGPIISIIVLGHHN